VKNWIIGKLLDVGIWVMDRILWLVEKREDRHG